MLSARLLKRCANATTNFRLRRHRVHSAESAVGIPVVSRQYSAPASNDKPQVFPPFTVGYYHTEGNRQTDFGAGQ